MQTQAQGKRIIFDIVRLRRSENQALELSSGISSIVGRGGKLLYTLRLKYVTILLNVCSCLYAPFCFYCSYRCTNALDTIYSSYSVRNTKY